MFENLKLGEKKKKKLRSIVGDVGGGKRKKSGKEGRGQPELKKKKAN